MANHQYLTWPFIEEKVTPPFQIIVCIYAAFNHVLTGACAGYVLVGIPTSPTQCLMGMIAGIALQNHYAIQDKIANGLVILLLIIVVIKHFILKPQQNDNTE